MMALGGFVGAMGGEWLVLASTSFIGAYLLMRGFAFFFGGYPSEYLIYFLIRNELPLDLNWTAWVYFSIFFVAFIFNYVWQTKHWH
jgi:hypothetical protein